MKRRDKVERSGTGKRQIRTWAAVDNDSSTSSVVVMVMADLKGPKKKAQGLQALRTG